MHSPNQNTVQGDDDADPPSDLPARLDRLETTINRVDRRVAAIATNLNASSRPTHAEGNRTTSAPMQDLQRPCKLSSAVNSTPGIPIGEVPISFPEAAQLIPLPKPPHPSTISRWATRGVRKIKLESWRIAGRRCTSHEAVDRFLEACRKQGFEGMDLGPWMERAMAAKEQLQ